MKCVLYSDLHTEFGKFKPRLDHSTYDVALLAGDIGVKVAGAAWVRENTENGFYIAGNHEFYGGSELFNHYKLLKNKETVAGQPGRMTFLQNEIHYGETRDGEKYRIFGATFWTDFSLEPEYTGGFELDLEKRYQAARYSMNDYNHIFHGAAPITPEVIHKQHNESLYWLDTFLSEPFDGKTIVMSHHAPSRYSITPGYREDSINYAYASNLEAVILKLKPHLWVHGHIHKSVDYMIGTTRVVANPRGYVGYEVNYEFKPNLILEV